MAKKKADKAPQVNKPEFIYNVDEVYNSGTSASTDFSSSNYATADSWVITNSPKTIEETMKNAGKRFDNFGKTFKKVSKKKGVKFCQTCGNMYEKGLDDNFCSAECKYKYCEIEDEADKHSE